MIKAGLLLDQHIEISPHAELGRVVEAEIRSSLSPFLFLPEYKAHYPEVVINALGNLYSEYNAVFSDLVAKNREWDTDYRHCMTEAGGSPVNFAIQIDMVGLPDGFLETAAGLSGREVREVLRGRIFEIENSLAMYQMLENIFSNGQQDSFFKKRFRAFLSELRGRFGMPIALLAVTDQKYLAMKASEFGKESGEFLSDSEVKNLSGFDKFFSPTEFHEHVEENAGGCKYVLYARTSDPVDRLRKPDLVVKHPLLSDPAMRRVIKAHALTFNIDAPEMDPHVRINDTKEYMPPMCMAFPISSVEDMLSSKLVAHLTAGKNGKPYGNFAGSSRLSPEFAAYLRSQGADPMEIESGGVTLRCKPMKGAYGGYGHVRGRLADSEFRTKLNRNLRQRGRYVIQCEMRTPTITNTTDGKMYTYIDRNFLAFTNGQPRFVGGFRLLMPVDSAEAQEGRIHGNRSAILAEITLT